MMNALTPRRWSLEEWMASEAAWSELLTSSDADPLFLSWDWLTQWWQWFGGRVGQVPEVLAFYRGDKLAGVAPLYRSVALRGRVLLAHSVQLIGLSWRDPGPLISEYLDVVAGRGDEVSVRGACLDALLADDGWNELVIGFTGAGRQWREALDKRGAPGQHYVREVDRSVSYQADLTGGFAAYLQSLGQSTRRSVWNLRPRLAMQGEVRFEQLGPQQVAAGFSDLNRLHQLRWNRPAFRGKRLTFHISLATRLAARGELALSSLRVGGRVVSVLYDIRKGAHQYNLKMGFDPSFSSRVSLGLIHSGYAMEIAANNGVRVYDFLAGPGRTRDYKQYLAQTRRQLSSVQIVRGRVLPRLYRWYDRHRARSGKIH
jgi:CelD/BcsL family acetyltransferase involved in cellulose biosynthesis